MQQKDKPARRDLGRLMTPFLEAGDRFLFFLIALLLLGTALLIIGYALFVFITEAGDNFALAVVLLINDLLLALIVLEVLSTVRSYLATGVTSLRIFLYVGIISAIRRILAIGAQTAVGETAGETNFAELLLDLAVNSGVVLVLALALYLLSLALPRFDPPRVAKAKEEAEEAGAPTFR